LNTSTTRACKQERESEAIKNLLGTRVRMSWRASKMAKHSVAVNEEVAGGRLLEKESFLIWKA